MINFIRLLGIGTLVGLYEFNPLVGVAVLVTGAGLVVTQRVRRQA